MPEPYTTQEGDTVDLIAFDQYGRTSGPTEMILRANPGLAAAGTVLPAGLKVTLPEIAPAAPVTVTRLWGEAS